MAKRHPGSIDRRGDSFRVRLSVADEKYSFSIKTHDRRSAERFAVQKMHELQQAHERKASGLPSGIRVSELFDLFERQELPTLAKGTREAYLDTLKPLRAYFVGRENRSVHEIRAHHVTAYLAWRRVNRLREPGKGRRAAPLTNRTLAKDRTVLHRIFAMADQLELRDGNPVARTRAPKADPRSPVILSANEYERLVAECDERPMLRLYVLTLGESGIRSESEALHLRWEDVDLERGDLWVASGREGHRTKSGKGRWVPMTARLRSAMREHFARYRLAAYDGKRSPYVFHHEYTHRRFRAGERIQSLRVAFRARAVRAKLPAELHQHDLRHRRATTWLSEGKSAVLVKEALGHADLRTTMAYTHLVREHMQALVSEPSGSSRSPVIDTKGVQKGVQRRRK